MRSASSMTEIAFSSSIHSSVLTWLPLLLRLLFGI